MINFKIFMQLELAYIPCAAHNIQLVIKDGLVFDAKITSLINKISKNIVSKSKFSYAIAEELRNLNIKLRTKNVTRWNSILFMVRSVLKLTPADFSTIQQSLPRTSRKQQEVKANFALSSTDRAILKELVELLESFEFVTNQLQGDGVSVSKVYPCFRFLDTFLQPEASDITPSKYKHTIQLRKQLL